MNLYTEEQIKKVLNPELFYLIEPQLTPIELPSDEEIRMQTQFATNDFYWGAKWMKEQIINKSK